MALTPIPYQALPFDVEENCTVLCQPWIQKIAKGDRTSFQFRYGPCANTRTVLTNGDFTNFGTDWTVSGSWVFTGASAVAPVATSGFIQQTITGAAGLYYTLSFIAEVDNGNLIVSTNAGVLGVYSVSGLYTVTFLSTGATNINFFFNTANGGELRQIEMKPVNTRVRFDVATLDGTSVGTIPAADYTFSRGFLTVNVDWDDLDLPDGCYKIQAFDPCECSQFGFMGDDFTIPNQILLFSGSGAVQAGAMTAINVNVGAGATVFRLRDALCRNVAYEFTFTVSGLNVGDRFRLGLGTVLGPNVTADGTYTQTITGAWPTDEQFDLRFIFDFAAQNLLGVDITDFSMEAVTPIVSSESVNFELKETHGCTSTLSWCGSSDQLGFGFGDTGFRPVVRLEGMYRASNYPTDRETYRMASGRHLTYYGNQQKEKLLSFSAPEYIHDFASKVLVASNVYVNDAAVHCTATDAPTVSWEDDFDMGHVQYPFVPSQELIENRQCASVTNTGCSTDGIGLFINRTGGVNIGNHGLKADGKLLNIG